MKSLRTLMLALCTVSLLTLAAPATSTAVPPISNAEPPISPDVEPPNTPAGRWVPSGTAAFDHLSRLPDALAVYNRGLAPEPGLNSHYQGIARVDGADGTPYLMISKSGVNIVDGDEPGYLLVARMNTRGRDGERMRTNFYPSTEEAALAQDKTVTAIPLDGSGDWPAFRHPGGMQVVGNVLAIGAETPFNGERAAATILFADVSDPEHPKYLGRFDPPGPDLPIFITTDPLTGLEITRTEGGFGTDPIGFTAIKTADGKCCRYLIVAAGGEANEQVRFFQSAANMPDDSTDLASPVEWEEVGRYTDDQLNACLTVPWPTSGLVQGGQHQMLNFVREGGLDGQLFLIGARRDGTIATPWAAEMLDMYEVNLSPEGIPDPCPLTHRNSTEVSEEAWGRGPAFSATFAAGTGLYVSPTGELIVYVTSHHGDPIIWVGEFRLWQVARDNSPTFRPTANVNGPFAVDEGSSVQLTGQGSAAKTKAFVELFEEGGAGSSIDQAMMIVDYPDRALANFGNLATIDINACDSILAAIRCLASLVDNEGTIWERTSSVRWFAPPGCTISLNDYPTNSSTWPGPASILLRGNGYVEEANNLGAVPVYYPDDERWPVTPVPSGTTETMQGLDDTIEGVTFHHQTRHNGGLADRHDCDGYYNATIGLGWDFDSNGSYDATGTSASFSASTLDGPSVATVTARAQHPTDTSPTGIGDPMSVPVTVRNVAPQVTSAVLSDSLGHDLAGPDSLALTGLPVSLDVRFTDPGVADTQTARVNWGDGTSATTFSTFTDARGGAVGQLRQSHVFPGPGTYTVSTTITDDDQGATTVQRSVVVVSAADLVETLADRLTTLIGQSTVPAVKAALVNARNELVGNHTGHPPTNGAVDKLEAGDPMSAITKLRAAIAFLQTAEAAGAGDPSTFKDLLGLAAESIATESYAQARSRFPVPTTKQATALRAIGDLITQGHQRLVLHQYLAACDSFRQATDKAVALRR